MRCVHRKAITVVPQTTRQSGVGSCIQPAPIGKVQSAISTYGLIHQQWNAFILVIGAMYYVPTSYEYTCMHAHTHTHSLSGRKAKKV